MKTMSAIMVAAAAFGLMQTAQPGTGCDFNLRVNYKTPNAITILSGENAASNHIRPPILFAASPRAFS